MALLPIFLKSKRGSYMVQTSLVVGDLFSWSQRDRRSPNKHPADQRQLAIFSFTN